MALTLFYVMLTLGPDVKVAMGGKQLQENLFFSCRWAGESLFSVGGQLHLPLLMYRPVITSAMYIR